MRVAALLIAGVMSLALRTSPPRVEQSSVELHVTVPPARVRIDGADYVVWRHTPNRTQWQYDLWRANFGAQGTGSAAGASVNATVPTPASSIAYERTRQS